MVPRGWRRSHNQAKAAARIAAISSGSATRYKDVALLASASSDPLLLASFGDLYLRPLGSSSRQRDTLRKTLLVYFSVNKNSESTGAVLGKSRQTVAARLKVVEDKLGQPLSHCGDQLHIALRLESLGLLESFGHLSTYIEVP